MFEPFLLMGIGIPIYTTVGSRRRQFKEASRHRQQNNRFEKGMGFG